MTTLKMLTPIVFAAVFPFLAACEPTSIRTAEFEGWLIDGATGKPVEGANVVASWELYHQGWHGIFFRQIAEVHETVSDKDGRFSFPRVTVRNPERHTLVGDPAVYIFKPGYKFVSRTGGCWGGDPCKDPRVPRIAGERVWMLLINSVFLENSRGNPEGYYDPYAS